MYKLTNAQISSILTSSIAIMTVTANYLSATPSASVTIAGLLSAFVAGAANYFTTHKAANTTSVTVTTPAQTTTQTVEAKPDEVKS